MVFFIFGPTEHSWATGNSVFTTHHNVSPNLASAFDTKVLTGNNVQWGSVGPQWICCFMLGMGQFYSTQTADLQEAIGDGSFEHVSFAPGGGWFVRKQFSMIRMSKSGTFPDSFHRLVREHAYLRIQDPSLQYSSLKNVFFGMDDAVVLQTDQGDVRWSNIPESLRTRIIQYHGEGWQISPGSSLCPWNKNYFFFEWTQPYNTQTKYAFNLPPGGMLSHDFVKELIAEEVPVSHKLLSNQLGTSNIPDDLRKSCAEVYRLATKEFGRSYLLGVEMAVLLKQVADKLSIQFDKSIPNAELAKIWEMSDLDENGHFTDDEWLFGVWLVFSRLGGHSLPEKKPLVPIATTVTTTTGITCEICKGEVSDVTYFCNICDNGDFDMCSACAIKGSKCPGRHQLLPIKMIERYFPLTSAGSLSDDLKSLNLSSNNGNSSGSANPSPYSQQSTPYSNSNQGNGSSNGDNDPSSRKADSKQLRDSLQSSILREKPDVKWDDVAGLEAAKEELQEAVVLPIKFPQMFTGKRKARRGILLYGPPGTGKSYLAKAVATEVDSTLFSVSSSDIVSKWHGESERLVKTLFDMARENKPSIIFIDEIDAICGHRDGGGGSDELSARMKTEFLVQMDGVGNDNTGVLLLAATNLPWVLDPAVRRRFQKKIHIPLPDESARSAIFQINIGSTPCGLTQKDYEELGRRTEGLSGSDIAIAVQDALMMPVKKISSSKHWRQVNHDGAIKFTPCGPQDQGATPMTWRQVEPSKLLEPTVQTEDFFTVLKGVKPSVGENDIKKCHEWTEQYGLEGA